MAGIFISYRRADSDGWAGRLRDALRGRFGDIVFQDVDNIPDGEIFSDVIDRALEKCDVALVIIGPNWASAVDEQGHRRLDQENDWVRTETSRVLNRKIRVIPVLVGGSRMPRPEDLPQELRSLTHRQAREIRSTSWDSDVAMLTTHLQQIVGHPGRRKLLTYGVPSLVALLAIGGFAGKRYFESGPGPINEEQSAPAKTASAPAPTAVPASPPAPAKSDQSEAILQKRVPPTAPTPEVAEAPKPKAHETPPSAPVTEAPPKKTKSAEAPTAAPAPPTHREPLASRPPPARTPPAARSAPPESESPKLARREAPPAPPPAREDPRKSAVEAEAPAERAAAVPPAAPKASSPAAARSATLNLPNRPASARDLKIGDSWTYKLKDARFSKELATVTYEINGGDASGIRETVRTAGANSGDGDSGGANRTSIQRRLPLEPRMFEQAIDRQVMVFEFAPFIGAFTDLQPGLRWSTIAAANSSDSIASWRFSGKVTGRESVRVPAGTFDTIKAELEGNYDVTFPSTRDPFNETVAAYQTYSIWFAPEVGREVKYERRTYNRGRRLLEHEQYELQRYQLK